MKKMMIAAGMLMIASSAFAATTVTATVRHMCCGSCKAAATEGLKKVAWVDKIALEGTKISVTVKDGQDANIVDLLGALKTSGFPASEVLTSGAVTATVAHLCCPGCTNDLKEKLGAVRNTTIDVAGIKIDDKAKTVTINPAAGKNINVVALMGVMDRTGFSASKVILATGTVASAGTKKAVTNR